MVAPDSDDWLELTESELPVATVATWVARPDCGAYVVFAGTVRDHAEGRPGVTALEYEAYAEQVVPRLARIAEEARVRWPAVRRVALLHRVGALQVTDVSVVVAVSTPHRAESFAAGHWCIDQLKASVPIWKKETWEGGVDWGSDARPVGAVGEVDSAR